MPPRAETGLDPEGTDAFGLTRLQIEERLRRVLTDRGLAHPCYAVAAPVVCGAEEVRLLVEVRAEGISQAGDPCFPGGRIEPGESPAEAAAREMEEELGIRVEPKDFLGQLPTVQTVLGSRSAVFVCTVSEEDEKSVCLNPSEVSELLHVPLSFFLERPDAASYPYGGHTIWGMTAGAIRHFCAAWRRAMEK